MVCNLHLRCSAKSEKNLFHAKLERNAHQEIQRKEKFSKVKLDVEDAPA